MANIENLSLDTRTFCQICATISKKEWVDLQSDLMQKLSKSAQCIYKWKRGLSQPSSVLDRKKISDCVNKRFDIYTRHWTLFPES